jgi:hypothetical protein
MFPLHIFEMYLVDVGGMSYLVLDCCLDHRHQTLQCKKNEVLWFFSGLITSYFFKRMTYKNA